jgi:nucleoside-diphosphate-sugar epimerase
VKILLTGSEGLIGSILKKYWIGIHELQFIDLLLGKDLNTCDLDYDVDVIVHLAGKSGVRQSIKEPKEYWYNNVEATKRLFDAFPSTKIIYASSSTAIDPYRNPYALTKFTMEHIAPNNSLGLRFRTVYGGDKRPEMFIPKLLRNEVTYINNHKRDFIHVSDVCKAITVLLSSSVTGVIDVGTGTSVHLKDIADVWGLDVPMRSGNDFELDDNLANPTELFDLGWKSEIGILDYLNQEKTLDKTSFSKYNVTIGDKS